MASSTFHYPAITHNGPPDINLDYFSHLIGSRTARSEGERRDSSLPTNFPASVISPLAWSVADLEYTAGQPPFTLLLSNAHIEELENACRIFKEFNLPYDDISRDNFPLPTLSLKLKPLAAELTGGVGFFNIRGLDPMRYSNETNVIIYLGVSSYIAEERGRQDELGNMLLHLTDLGAEACPENERQAPYSNVGQPFHTDTGDIIALYSLNEAECGGESQLASMATIYSQIAKTRPDIINTLSSHSWIFDRFGQWPSYLIRSILYPILNEKVMLSFSRRPLVGNTSSPRSHNIPDLDSSQIEALNMVQSVAEQHALSIKLKPGDMLFWNNLALLHSRAGFTDSSDRKRHLLRLWLRNHETEKNWPIPPELQAAWTEAFDHAGRPQLWPIEPIRDREYIANQQRSSGHD